MRFKLSITQAFTVAFVLALFLFFAVLGIYYRQEQYKKKSANLISESHNLLFSSERLSFTATEIETNSRAYLFSGYPQFLAAYQKSKESFPAQAAELKSMIGDRTYQQMLLDSVSYYVNKRIRFSDSIVALRGKVTSNQALYVVSAGGFIQYLDNIKRITIALQEKESQLLNNENKRNATNAFAEQMIFIAIATGAFTLLLVLFNKEKKWLRQKQRQQTEKHFGLLANNIKDYAVLMLDPNGTIVSWSRGAEFIKGYTEDEIIGKHISLFYTDKDVNKNEPWRNLEIAKEKGFYDSEGWRVKKDGSLFWANVLFTALKDEDGKLYGYTKVTRDITEKRKIQEQLELLYRQIDQANDAIYTTDASTVINSWNRGAERLYGFSKTEVIGRKANDILQTDLSIEEIMRLKSFVNEKDHWSGDLKRKTKAGKDIYVYASLSTIRNEMKEVTGYISVNYDITEQKKLRDQVEHLANIVEQSSEAIFSRDLNRRIITWNSGAEKLFGFTREEAMGTTAQELGFLMLDNVAIDAVYMQLKTIGNWSSEVQYRHKNGTFFYGEVVANVTRDEKENITSFYFIVKDVSARKQLQEQMRRYSEALEKEVDERTREIIQNEKKYRALIENNYDSIVLLDASLQIIYRSPSVYRTLGYDESLEPSANIFDYFHPDDTEFAREKIAQLLQQPGVRVTALFRLQHQLGHYIWMEGVLNNKLNDKEVNGIIVNLREVTERIVAEEKINHTLKELSDYKEALDESSIVAITDQKGTITHVNENFCRISRYSKEELIGKDHRIINSGYHTSDFIRNLWVTIANGKVWKGEMRNRAKDGSIYWVDTTIVPFMNEKGKPYQYMAIRSDITERKNAEEAINQLNRELEERVNKRTEELKKANSEMEAFSYSVSHDLRAPLRAVHGFSRILEEDYGNKIGGDASRVIGVIKSNTVKMGNLIDDLLAFSRMGKSTVNKTRIDNNEVVQEVIKSIEVNDIEWLIHPLPEAMADRNLLRQVWVNFISNAVKYSSHNKTARVEIGSYTGNGELVFYIKDNGVGFDEQYKHKLFKVFQRLHGADEFEGTGIGLAIVEKIISKHGGTVWAEGELDNGATFYFSLPAD